MIEQTLRTFSVYEFDKRISTDDKERKIILDNTDFTNEKIIVKLALEGVYLPVIYLFENRYGSYEVVKGSNIINALTKYTHIKNHKGAFRARIEDTILQCVVIYYENYERFEEIKNMLNQI